MIDETVDALRAHTSLEPKVGMILGSGLGPLAEAVEDPVILPTSELPHWPTSTVEGHAGRLLLGHLEGQPVMVLQGRAHFYEGYPMPMIVHIEPVRKSHPKHYLVECHLQTSCNSSFSEGF